VDHTEMLRILSEIRSEARKALKGVPSDGDIKKLTGGRLTAADIERLVDEAVAEIEKKLGVDAKDLKKNIRTKFIEVTRDSAPVVKTSGDTKSAHDHKSDRQSDHKSAKDSDSDSASDSDSSESSSSDSSSSSSGGPPAPGKVPPVPAKRTSKPVKLTPGEKRLPKTTLFVRKRPNGNYVLATYSFEHTTRDNVQLTHNDWDVLLDEHDEGDVFTVNMVTDDRSGIADLGPGDLTRMAKQRRALKKTRLSDNLLVKHGHVYLVRTKDTDTDQWALLKVVNLRPDRSVDLIWKIIR